VRSLRCSPVSSSSAVGIRPSCYYSLSVFLLSLFFPSFFLSPLSFLSFSFLSLFTYTRSSSPHSLLLSILPPPSYFPFIVFIFVSRHSDGLNVRSLNPVRANRCFCSLQRPYRLLVPPCHRSSGYRQASSPGKSAVA
jgi:hypothetical protein